MRIGIVIHEYPPIGGGAATAAAYTARALVAEGHEVLVVTSSGGGRGVAREDGVSIARLPDLRRSVVTPSARELLAFCGSAAMLLERRLRVFGAEGVLAYFAVPAGPFAVIAAGRLGIPVIVSPRGSDVRFDQGRLGGLAGAIARPVIRWTFGRADLVAPNNEALRDHTLAIAPDLRTTDKLVIVPNGIDPDAIVAQHVRTAGDAIRLVIVGHLTAGKRVSLALQALARLRDRGIAARLTVIGDGPLRSALAREAETLRVAGHVVFTGRLSRDDVLARMRDHDLFVMPSAAEGMSNAVLEAMASGLPVVIAANGTHDVVAGAGCGVVVPVDDLAAFTDAIAELAAATSRREALARAGLDHVRGLTWGASARRFAELLHAVR